MKRYLTLIIVAILILTPVLLVGCTQEAGLENRIASLERKLTISESTIKVLQERIEQLEGPSDEDILTKLMNIDGRGFRVDIGKITVGNRSFWSDCYIEFKGIVP